MNNETLKLITDRFTKLPAEVQAFVGDRSWAGSVQSIAEQNNLSEEQAEGLVIESALILVGLAHIDDLTMELRERLSLSQEIASGISAEVSAIIPDEVKKLLGDICAKEAVPSIPLTPKTPTPPPAPQTPVQPASPFEEKLKRVFTVPREESRVASAPAAPKAPTPPATPRPAGSDPYREPLH